MKACLNLQNLTNLDKSIPGVVEGSGALMLASSKDFDTAISLIGSENIGISGFNVRIMKPWKFRFVRWILARLS